MPKLGNQVQRPCWKWVRVVGEHGIYDYQYGLDIYKQNPPMGNWRPRNSLCPPNDTRGPRWQRWRYPGGLALIQTPLPPLPRSIHHGFGALCQRDLRQGRLAALLIKGRVGATERG